MQNLPPVRPARSTAPTPRPGDLLTQLNVNQAGEGPTTLLFIHGFGCNQSMWRHILPALTRDCRVVVLDLAGCGLSDPEAWEPRRHQSLEGHALDVLSVAAAVDDGSDLVLVGHSVGATVAMLASCLAPEGFAAQVLVAPSPCFVNDQDYPGGFAAHEIEELVRFMRSDQEGWAAHLADLVIGGPARETLAGELVASFCAMQPQAAEPFARLSFEQDQRGLLPLVQVPTLMLQSHDDVLVPPGVADYMRRAIADSTLITLDNTGHAPHLTQPQECAGAMRAWLAGLGLVSVPGLPLPRPGRRSRREA